jgi:hypothetical protein
VSIESRVSRLEQQKTQKGFDADCGPGTILLRPGDPDPPPLKPGCKGRIILDCRLDRRDRDLSPRAETKGPDWWMYLDPQDANA